MSPKCPPKQRGKQRLRDFFLTVTQDKQNPAHLSLSVHEMKSCICMLNSLRMPPLSVGKRENTFLEFQKAFWSFLFVEH